MESSETASVSSRASSSSARPKNYICDEPDCGKAYSKPSLLEQHKRSHTNERPFKCSETGCDKSFLRKSHLQAHLLSHEDQESKPFQCATCGKGVNTLQHLKRHEITHTKSFICTFEGCNESFYKHQSLRHHTLSVHEKNYYAISVINRLTDRIDWHSTILNITVTRRLINVTIKAVLEIL